MKASLETFCKASGARINWERFKKFIDYRKRKHLDDAQMPHQLDTLDARLVKISLQDSK
jgi:hypothetical protein